MAIIIKDALFESKQKAYESQHRDRVLAALGAVHCQQDQGMYHQQDQGMQADHSAVRDRNNQLLLIGENT